MNLLIARCQLVYSNSEFIIKNSSLITNFNELYVYIDRFSANSMIFRHHL